MMPFTRRYTAPSFRCVSMLQHVCVHAAPFTDPRHAICTKSANATAASEPHVPPRGTDTNVRAHPPQVRPCSAVPCRQQPSRQHTCTTSVQSSTLARPIQVPCLRTTRCSNPLVHHRLAPALAPSLQQLPPQLPPPCNTLSCMRRTCVSQHAIMHHESSVPPLCAMLQPTGTLPPRSLFSALPPKPHHYKPSHPTIRTPKAVHRRSPAPHSPCPPPLAIDHPGAVGHPAVPSVKVRVLVAGRFVVVHALAHALARPV